MFTFSTGQCTRIDQNGIRCKHINSNSSAFLLHDHRHDIDLKELTCPEARCHWVFNAFEQANPVEQFRKHLEAHTSDSASKMKGFTKLALQFPCELLNTTNDKLCGFSFAKRKHLKRHQREHRKTWRCNEQSGIEKCPASYSAFTSSSPSADLISHQNSNHGINSATCPDCGACFRDIRDSNRANFLCEDQVKAHRLGGRCFNYLAPVNYLWVGYTLNELIKQSIDNQLIVYSGRSYNGLFRALDTLAVLYLNYKKTENDPKRNRKQVEIYDQTVRGGGLYLMVVNQQIVKDEALFDQACRLVDASECASQCIF